MADYGADVSCLDDLDPYFSLVSGKPALAQALSRRLTTPRGSLVYDPEYGIDLRSYLNASPSMHDLSVAKSAIEAEVTADERVSAATAVVSFDRRTSILTVSIDVESAIGPFRLVLASTGVSVSVLRESA